MTMASTSAKDRLTKLIGDCSKVLATRQTSSQGHEQLNEPAAHGWATNAQALVRSIFGPDSEHYREASRFGSLYLSPERIEILQGILRSAADALDQGYVFEMRQLARADVEGDLITQAQELHAASYSRAAVVIAGAVLEEHLRAVAPSWSVATTNAAGKNLTLEPLNVELKRAGAYDDVMRSRITAMGTTRNEVAHGQPFNRTDDEVRRFIEDVIDVCDRVRTH